MENMTPKLSPKVRAGAASLGRGDCTSKGAIRKYQDSYRKRLEVPDVEPSSVA